MNKRDHVLNGVLLSIGTGVLLGIAPSIGLAAAERTLPTEPVGAAVGVLEQVVRFFVPVVLGALFPDVDTAFGKHRKTLHNVFVLGVFLAYPALFGNLHFVWIGVVTHLVLDMAGSARGVALFYPLSPREFSLPGGVPVSSKWATPLTVGITAAELVVMALVHYYVVPLDANVATVQRTMLGALVGGVGQYTRTPSKRPS
ncbi:MAG: metal-dependent hydrolase [Haloferacaceae archaeon]